MTYTHLTTDELVMIESYFKINQSVAKTAYCLNRSRQTIHKVYLFFKQGKSALEYYQQYKKNKSNCGRRPLVLPEEQSEYIQRKVVQGWTPDVIRFLFVVLLVPFIVCSKRGYLILLTYR